MTLLDLIHCRRPGHLGVPAVEILSQRRRGILHPPSMPTGSPPRAAGLHQEDSRKTGAADKLGCASAHGARLIRPGAVCHIP
jgi:hypothetical protein